MKKIINLFFIFFTILISFFYQNVFAIDAENFNNGVTNITLEFKLEDIDKNDLNLKIKAVWKNKLLNKTYATQYFGEDGFISISKKLPKDELDGYLLLYNSSSKEEDKVLDKTIKIPLSYNIQGISGSKRILYYLQFDRKENLYELKKYYNQYDEVDDTSSTTDNSLELKGKIESFYSIKGLEVGLYDEEGKKIYNGFINQNKEFIIDISDYKDKISIGKNYYLIRGKIGDLKKQDYGFLYKGKLFNFKSYKELYETFKNGNFNNLEIIQNQKDQKATENFPWLLLTILIFIYAILVYYIFFVKVIKKSFIHPLKGTYNYLSTSRETKILNIKESLGLKK